MINMIREKRLIFGILASVIAVATVSVSFSIAWYATSSNLFIDTLSLEVGTSPELLISTKIDGNYKDNLEKSELNKVEIFQPVSTMFKDRWMSNKSDKPIFYEHLSEYVHPTTHEPYVEAVTWGYYSQELFLRASGNVYVTIDPESFVMKPNEEMNSATADELIDEPRGKEMTKEEIITKLNDLVNCMRVSVLDPDEKTYSYVILDPNKNGDVLMGGRQNLGKDPYFDYYYYENEAFEIIYGDVKNRDLAVYAPASDEDITYSGEQNSFNASTEAGVRGFKLEESLEAGLEIAKEDSASLNNIEKKLMIPIKPEVPKRIVLSIYMEGWDKDCVNHHMGGSFDTKIQFKVLRENN